MQMHLNLTPYLGRRQRPCWNPSPNLSSAQTFVMCRGQTYMSGGLNILFWDSWFSGEGLGVSGDVGRCTSIPSREQAEGDRLGHTNPVPLLPRCPRPRPSRRRRLCSPQRPRVAGLALQRSNNGPVVMEGKTFGRWRRTGEMRRGEWRELRVRTDQDAKQGTKELLQRRRARCGAALPKFIRKERWCV